LDLKLDNLIKLNQLGISISTVHGLSISPPPLSAFLSLLPLDPSLLFFCSCVRYHLPANFSVLTSYILPFSLVPTHFSPNGFAIRSVSSPFLSFAGEMTKPRPLVVVRRE
jgi:hypothetical protein